MKCFLLIILIMLSACPSFSQISSQKIYTINVKNLWTLGDKNRGDTTAVTEPAFTVKLDAGNISQDSVIKSVKKTVSGVDQTITGLDAGNDFTIAANSPITLSFVLGITISNPDTTFNKSKSTIQYKIGNDTAFKEVLTENLANEMLSLNKTSGVVLSFTQSGDSLIIGEKTDTIVVKEVRIVFLQRADTRTTQEKQNDETISLLKQILNGAGGKQAIGWFTLKKKSVNVYQLQNGKETLFKPNQPIKSITITVENGAIAKKGIAVQLNQEDSLLFRNQRSPITIYGLRRRYADRLFVENDSAALFVKTGELFYYNYKGKFHYPDNESATISPIQTVDSLYNYTEFNDIIDVTLYTDLLALVSRKPNGIIQTQVSGNFITNTRGLIPNFNFFLMNFIQPYFRLSKFDSRFAQIDSNIIKKDTAYNKLFLTQTSYLQAGVKFNIFRLGLGPNQEILVNMGVDVNLTSADSLFKKDISFVNYYPEVAYRVNGMENFGLDVSMKWIRQEYAKSSPFVNREAIWVFNPQVTAYYSPFANKNAKIYVRYANFAEIKAGKSNFGQFQFGLKTNLFKKEK